MARMKEPTESAVLTSSEDMKAAKAAMYPLVTEFPPVSILFMARLSFFLDCVLVCWLAQCGYVQGFVGLDYY